MFTSYSKVDEYFEDYFTKIATGIACVIYTQENMLNITFDTRS